MDYHAGRSSRMSGRQKGRRINQPTHAKTHGWVIIAGLSNCLSSASGKHRHRVMYRSRKTPVKQALFSTLISSTSERSRRLGHGPRYSCRFPGDHRVAKTPTPGWKIDMWTKIPRPATTCASGLERRKRSTRRWVHAPGPAKPPRSCSVSARPLAMMTSRLLVTNSPGGCPGSRDSGRVEVSLAHGGPPFPVKHGGRDATGVTPGRTSRRASFLTGRRPSGNRPRRPSTGRRRHRAE